MTTQPSSTPIRVGLIGLYGAPPSEYEGVSWTLSAHLPYLRVSPRYEIVALLNRSIASGKAAVERYKLPDDVKCYEDAEELAKDKNVDLVVCSTRVDTHFKLLRPSIIARKAVFTEWPMDRNLSTAQEMTSLAKAHNCTTIVGLQASFDPVIRTLEAWVDEGRLGRVLSSTVLGSEGNGGETEVKNVRYFLDRSVGGNILTIRFGHFLECMTSVFGDFEHQTSLLSNRHPTKDIIDPANNNIVVEASKSNTVPDQIMLQGTTTRDCIPISMHFRGGPAFPNTPGLEWRIQGSNGELRVISSSTSMNVGREDTKIEFWDREEEKVKVVSVEKDYWSAGGKGGFDFAVGNIARLYEAYADGKWVPDWEWGLRKHVFIEGMWKGFDDLEGRRVLDGGWTLPNIAQQLDSCNNSCTKK